MSRNQPETRRLVLLVNDDPAGGEAVDEWLEMRGAAILRAFSTAHALELMKRARMNVVISDLARNEGQLLNKMAGMELARAIRNSGSDVPLVIYTRDKSPMVRELAVEAGANYVTERPDELVDWLEKMGL
ncbi:MAG: response regulator [Chromatiaceae bacterium]|nr:response regulator [Chromatiaceae bacterium]MBP6733318.1 response regulator [Chromatiaceae bacterium]MBP6806812.1 response regulator [Chromatiaceae bacterium]MBP8282499.1 response regulator [Chromatiaceae bacterium]MBP8288417.1 response regulator [Chromatiaceae bacterium]